MAVDYNLIAGMGERYNRGLAQGQENRLLAEEAARQEEFRNIVAEFVGPDQAAIAQGGIPGMPAGAPQIPPGAVNRLMAIDPERTTALLGAQQQQQIAHQQQRQAVAREALARMQYVLDSENPGMALQLAGRMSDGSDLAEMLAEQGLVDLEDGISDDEARLIAEAGIATYGPMAGLEPAEAESPFADIDPSDYTPESVSEFQRTGDYGALRPAVQEETSDFETKMRVVTNALGRDLTEAEVLDLAGISPEQADTLETEQIPPTQLANVRLPDGSTPEIGTTWGEALEAGAKVFSADEIKKQQSLEAALHTLNELENMALGDNGVFVDNGGSVLTNNVLARMANGIQNGLGALIGTEASERRAIFDATSRGVLSSLVRSMGESGALSDGDVRRALELIPTLGVVPDTERKARQQFAELRTIISRGAESLQESSGVEAELDLGDGWSARQVR